MKKTYVILSIIIMLLSLLAACVNDTGIQPDTSMPQQSQPTAAAAITPKPTATATVTPIPTASAAITPEPTLPEWPEAYSTILEEYKTLAGYVFQDLDALIDIMDSEDYDVYDEWEKKNIPVLGEEGIFWEEGFPLADDKDAYGYALKDLNGDGSDELILLLKDYTVLAVFSTADGKPKLLDRFWDRYYCCPIDKSCLLYIVCSYDGWENWYYAIKRLSDDGSEFLTIARYGMETYDYDTRERYSESHYYKIVDGKSYSERDIISKAEFDELYDAWEKATENADNSGITFIPILD